MRASVRQLWLAILPCLSTMSCKSNTQQTDLKDSEYHISKAGAVFEWFEFIDHKTTMGQDDHPYIRFGLEKKEESLTGAFEKTEKVKYFSNSTPKVQSTILYPTVSKISEAEYTPRISANSYSNELALFVTPKNAVNLKNIRAEFQVAVGEVNRKDHWVRLCSGRYSNNCNIDLDFVSRGPNFSFTEDQIRGGEATRFSFSINLPTTGPGSQSAATKRINFTCSTKDSDLFVTKDIPVVPSKSSTDADLGRTPSDALAVTAEYRARLKATSGSEIWLDKSISCNNIVDVLAYFPTRRVDGISMVFTREKAPDEKPESSPFDVLTVADKM